MTNKLGPESYLYNLFFIKIKLQPWCFLCGVPFPQLIGVLVGSLQTRKLYAWRGQRYNIIRAWQGASQYFQPIVLNAPYVVSQTCTEIHMCMHTPQRIGERREELLSSFGFAFLKKWQLDSSFINHKFWCCLQKRKASLDFQCIFCLLVGFASQINCKGGGCILNRLPYLGSFWQECRDGLTCITEGLSDPGRQQNLK